MRVIEWTRASRRLSQADIDDFYHSPLADLTLFRFTTSRLGVPAHDGPFSLKLVLEGEETYSFGRRSVRLRPGQILFTNEGETYSSRIDARATSLALFAPPREAAAAARLVREPDETLLDDPFSDGPAPAPAQIAFGASKASLLALMALGRGLDAGDRPLALERARALLVAALADAFRSFPENALASVRKRSTQDELLARALRARTMIDDSNGQLANLDTLAEAACLSKHHFLRVFSEACGRAPGAYARRRRLEVADGALARGEDPRAVARRAGFRDLRAFYRAFRREMGRPAPQSRAN